MVNEIIVAFLGTLLLINRSESKPVTPLLHRVCDGLSILTPPGPAIIPTRDLGCT